MSRHLWALLLLLLVLTTPAMAHEIRPGFLEIREKSDGRFEVLWKVPLQLGLRLPLTPVFPEDCSTVTPVSSYSAPGAVVESWVMRCSQPLVGRRVEIQGLEATLVDVMVRYHGLGADVQITRLQASDPGWEVVEEAEGLSGATAYLSMGIEHILVGIDHLLFVLGLLLLVPSRGLLLKTITAFTVAHSITLALATLGVVHVAQRPVDAAIALSIVFLGTELVKLRRGVVSLTARRPWVAAFGFGLLHGVGFAGALTELGLPAAEIPLALLFFNVGVEIGQLIFVAVIVSLMASWRQMRIHWPRWSKPLPAYSIGTLASFWFISRFVSFFE